MLDELRTGLLKWFDENKRSLPWRDDQTPYNIWLSEIIMQQTRVEQGTPYYLAFKKKYPKLQDLALADEHEVLKLWQGLGYYSRARNILHTAKDLTNNYGARFPSDFSELKKLKGIGDYTAAAISSMAFNKPHAVLDGNVYRILSRIFDIPEPINKPAAKKSFSKLANELLDKRRPGDFNEAMMDFGAIQCTPRNPKCLICPLNHLCLAYNSNKVAERPVKYKSKPKTERFFHYFLIDENEGLWLHKRDKKGIWEKLYELPVIEEYKGLALSDKTIKQKLGNLAEAELIDQKIHILSHQRIHAKLYKVSLPELSAGFKAQNKWVSYEQLDSYPLPKLVEKLLEKHLNSH